MIFVLGREDKAQISYIFPHKFDQACKAKLEKFPNQIWKCCVNAQSIDFLWNVLKKWNGIFNRAWSWIYFRLESPTRSLVMEAPKGVEINAEAGNMEATCRTELRLESKDGEVGGRGTEVQRNTAPISQHFLKRHSLCHCSQPALYAKKKKKKKSQSEVLFLEQICWTPQL